MSVKVSALCWKVPLPVIQKVVLVRLADYAKDGGGSIFPAVGTVAIECGISSRAVQVAFKKLIETGVLRLVEASTGGRGRTSRYALDLPRIMELGGVQPDHGGPSSGVQAEPETAQNPEHGAGFNGAINPEHGAGFSVNPERGARNPEPPAQNPLESTKEEDEDLRACAQAREIGDRVAVLAGMKPDPRRDLTPVLEWLASGADPDRDIYPAVHLVLSRTLQTEIRRFGFFSAEVENFRAARTHTPVKASANVHPLRPAAAQQYRQPPGRATGGTAALRHLARILEDEDRDAGSSGVWPR